MFGPIDASTSNPPVRLQLPSTSNPSASNPRPPAIQARKPDIQPNDGFMEQLIAFEVRIHGAASVSLERGKGKGKGKDRKGRKGTRYGGYFYRQRGGGLLSMCVRVCRTCLSCLTSADALSSLLICACFECTQAAGKRR